jgi:hypothetical protein
MWGIFEAIFLWREEEAAVLLKWRSNRIFFVNEETTIKYLQAYFVQVNKII